MKWTIKGLRLATEMTPKELASVMGVSEKTILRAEEDPREMRVTTFNKYLSVFQVNPNDVTFRKSDKKNPLERIDVCDLWLLANELHINISTIFEAIDSISKKVEVKA